MLIFPALQHAFIGYGIQRVERNEDSPPVHLTPLLYYDHDDCELTVSAGPQSGCTYMLSLEDIQATDWEVT